MGQFNSMALLLGLVGCVLAQFVPESSLEHPRLIGLPFASLRQLKPDSIEAAAADGENYFDQKLDHLASKSSTFKQRYFLNSKYAKGAEANFLLLQGQYPAVADKVSNEQYPFVSTAKAQGAKVWSLEHRFYGKSQPVSKGASLDNLVFLNSIQVIEDISDFIKAQNAASGEKNPKWVCYGIGYSGSLCLILRLKYPGLTVGAVTSSPLALPVVDDYKYQKNVEDAYNSYDPKCYANFAAVITAAQQAIQSTSGRQQLAKSLKLQPVFSAKPGYAELQNFFAAVASLFQIPVLYNKVNNGPWATGYGIQDVCAKLADSKADNIAKLANVAAYVLPLLSGAPFTAFPNDYNEFLITLKNEKYDADGFSMGSRLALWQSCSEFGDFPTTDFGGLAFQSSIPNNFFLNLCVDVFGSQFNVDNLKKVTKLSQKNFGADLVFQGSNVVITQGSLDPLRSLGFNSTTQPSSVAYSIDGTSHGADLQPPSSNDNYGLKFARNLASTKVAGWLNPKKASRLADKREKVRAAKLTLDLKKEEPKIQNWEAKIEWNVSKTEVKKPKSTRWHSIVKRFDLSKHLSHRFPGSSKTHNARVIKSYITQPLDQFNASIKRTWKQKFYSYDGYFKTGGPNFLMLGGEGPIDENYVSTGLQYMAWAKQYNAYAYALEHRFYGESQPTSDLSTANLKWLTSQQALADAAVFIKQVNKDRKLTNPKWIVFGGSYPGNLAAWFRLKYPDLVYASVASSAPVLAKVDFFEYMQVVDNSSRAFGGKSCADDVHSFFAWMQQKFTSTEGRKTVSKTFQLCDKWDGDYVNEKDLQTLMDDVMGSMAGSTQYDDEGHGRLQHVCKSFSDFDKEVGAKALTEDDRFVAIGKRLAKILWGKKSDDYGGYNDGDGDDYGNDSGDYGGGKCQPVSYQGELDYLRDVNPDDSSYRGWVWQTCNEMGFFQSTNMGYNIFESALPVNFYIDFCRDVYDVTITRDFIESKVKFTNDYYGGNENFTGTRVVFVNGSEDPWHVLSVLLENVKPGYSSILIDGTSHCDDMYATRSSTKKEVKVAQQQIKALLDQWIKN